MNKDYLTVEKLTPSIGAELSGMDLSGSLKKTFLDQIYNALIEHHVVFLRNQNISPENHLALAESLGDPQLSNPLYPRHDISDTIMILSSSPDSPPDTGGWHTDVTYKQNPPFACVVVARNVPDCGGDTLWLSLARAWDTLPPGIQSELEELNAVHDLGDFRNKEAMPELALPYPKKILFDELAETYL